MNTVLRETPNFIMTKERKRAGKRAGGWMYFITARGSLRRNQKELEAISDSIDPNHNRNYYGAHRWKWINREEAEKVWLWLVLGWG